MDGCNVFGCLYYVLIRVVSGMAWNSHRVGIMESAPVIIGSLLH